MLVNDLKKPTFQFHTNSKLGVARFETHDQSFKQLAVFRCFLIWFYLNYYIKEKLYVARTCMATSDLGNWFGKARQKGISNVSLLQNWHLSHLLRILSLIWVWYLILTNLILEKLGQTCFSKIKKIIVSRLTIKWRWQSTFFRLEVGGFA